MIGSLPLGEFTPGRRAVRVTLTQWCLAITHPDGPASPTTRLVLLTLLRWGNWKDGSSMYPSIEMLALATGLSVSAVGIHLALAFKTGWLWRYKVRGARQKYWNYSYESVVPASWQSRLAHLREWEKDGAASEARLAARTRPRAKHPVVNCPDLNGNDSGTTVVSRSVTSAEPPLASSTTENHPVQECTTSSSTSSVTSTKTSSGSMSDLHGVDKQLHGKRLREAALRQPAHADYATVMERCLQRYQDEGVVINLNNPDDVMLLRVSCGLKTNEEAMKIVKQLFDEGRLPTPSVAALKPPEVKPHEEPASSTVRGDPPSAVTPSSAQA